MDKVKKVLHLRSKSKTDPELSAGAETRASIDSELAAMTPEEREAYLKEFEEAERTGVPKKGSLIDKLIERGNRRTEEQLLRESAEREGRKGEVREGQVRM